MSVTPGRGNGLTAASYLPLVDLDPQLADAVLELLREEGIAAYAVPAGNRPHGAIVISRLDRPLDRVHADRAEAVRARALLDERLPALRDEHEADAADRVPGAREDEAWSRIVAAYHAEDTDPTPRWPAREDVDLRSLPENRGPEPDPGSSPTAERVLRPASSDPRAYSPVPEVPATEDHYVPPPPPPLPRTDTVTKLAWAGLVGAPVVLLLALSLGVGFSGWAGLLAVGAFVGGFVTLVARMKDRAPEDYGPDDGAVV